MSESDDLLTLDELAALLKVKPSWIYGETCKAERSKIPFVKVGKHLRFQKKQVFESLGIK